MLICPYWKVPENGGLFVPNPGPLAFWKAVTGHIETFKALNVMHGSIASGSYLLLPAVPPSPYLIFKSCVCEAFPRGLNLRFSMPGESALRISKSTYNYRCFYKLLHPFPPS